MLAVYLGRALDKCATPAERHQVLQRVAKILRPHHYGFSFPLRYVEAYGLLLFLDDFQHHWPTNDTFTPMSISSTMACTATAEGGFDVQESVAPAVIPGKTITAFSETGEPHAR